jgi:hypothetical protein
MTFDEYNEKIAQIADELQAIADRTAQQALVGSANSSNPMFVQIMQRHAQLVKLSADLTERMIALMGRAA